jgi:hypothetical protein
MLVGRVFHIPECCSGAAELSSFGETFSARFAFFAGIFCVEFVKEFLFAKGKPKSTKMAKTKGFRQYDFTIIMLSNTVKQF